MQMKRQLFIADAIDFNSDPTTTAHVPGSARQICRTRSMASLFSDDVGMMQLVSLRLRFSERGSAAPQCGKACLSENCSKIFRGCASTPGIAWQNELGGTYR
jgi:hypothetical protein